MTLAQLSQVPRLVTIIEVMSRYVVSRVSKLQKIDPNHRL